jgi:hypothetical protein
MRILTIVARYVPTQIQSGNIFYVGCVIAVSLLLVFGITIPIDGLRKKFGARVPMVTVDSPSHSTRASRDACDA